MNPVDISIYGIIDPARTKGRDLGILASEAVAGSVTLLQYRHKSDDVREMIRQATAIREAISGTGIPLLINDRVDVALAVEADGVHLGQSDMPADIARKILGEEAIIGLTIKEKEHATNAPTDLLDYVCIGGVYETLSKDNPRSIGVEGWTELAAHFHKAASALPVGAIAGITPKNMKPLLDAGADGVAIISAIFMQDDVRAAAQAFADKFSEMKS